MNDVVYPVSDPSSPGHPAGLRVLRWSPIILVWAVWVTGTLALFLYVRHYARNIPFIDDWTLVPIITGNQPMSLSWAWSQHNEHRVLIPKLIHVSLIRWVAPDFRTCLYFNAGLLSLAAAMMIVLARRLRGHQRFTDAVLPLSILTLAQYVVLLCGFTLALVLTALLTYELIVVLGSSTQRRPWRSVIPIGITLVILPLCGGGGLVMLPPLALWLAGYICCGWWSGRVPGTWARAFGLLSLMACSAVVALYLTNYVRMRPPVPSLNAIVRASLEFLSLSLWSSAAAYWPAGYWKIAGLTVLALVAASLVRLTAVAVRYPYERPRAVGLAALILSLMGVAVAVGVASSGYGPGGGLASRYVPLAVPLLIALYFTWLIYTPARSRTVLQCCLLLVVCLSVPGSLKTARNEGEPFLQCYKRIERSLRAGMSDSQILDLVCPTVCPAPTRKFASVWIPMLRSSGFGKFKYLDDAQIAITSKPETMRR